MNNLLDILMRFKEERMAIISHIEVIFHQVRVTPNDCDVVGPGRCEQESCRIQKGRSFI